MTATDIDLTTSDGVARVAYRAWARRRGERTDFDALPAAVRSAWTAAVENAAAPVFVLVNGTTSVNLRLVRHAWWEADRAGLSAHLRLEIPGQPPVAVPASAPEAGTVARALGLSAEFDAWPAKQAAAAAALAERRATEKRQAEERELQASLRRAEASGLGGLLRKLGIVRPTATT